MSAKAWSAEFDSSTREWCRRIAELTVDGLFMAKLIARDELDKTIEIAAEEIYARLCVRDYPPYPETD